MSDVVGAGAAGGAREYFGRWGRSARARRLLWPFVSDGVTAFLAVLAVESVARGSILASAPFFLDYYRPGWSTVLLYAGALALLEAAAGRRRAGLVLIVPPMLFLAFVSSQKAYYLGDPVYPIDMFYARQVADLMPMLVRERPVAGLALAAGIVVLVGLAVAVWRARRVVMPGIGWRSRGLRLLFALPVLALFATTLDYASYSWTRDRLKIVPMMWDQKENYAFNGLSLAFVLNIPMANVPAPAGYGAKAIAAISRPQGAAPAGGERPDVIMVMSESFWDPARLPGVTLSPDPLTNVRKVQSGYVFSPEFGGTTPNVEFEALTGFSNAFLPYGSIPYQQYVRRPVPSLASFFSSQGYLTRAIHPYRAFFWNRGPVYREFGFDEFRSEENLPPLAKRGPLASDAALTEEIIREGDEADRPFFFFVVTLQGHGPYEANRYPDATMEVETSADEATRESIRTYAEGAADADRGLGRLIDWARGRSRPTVIAFWGDHLPPLGPVYVATGFMDGPVAERQGPLGRMSRQHETPLVIWSNRTGRAKDVSSVSPAFLPYHVLKTAGMSHPYYTGYLGAMREKYRVVDRNMLVPRKGPAVHGWSKRGNLDPAIRDWRLLQYDMIFGRRTAAPDFFPETVQSADKPAA